jgi:hypothetical protein
MLKLIFLLFKTMSLSECSSSRELSDLMIKNGIRHPDLPNITPSLLYFLLDSGQISNEGIGKHAVLIKNLTMCKELLERGNSTYILASHACEYGFTQLASILIPQSTGFIQPILRSACREGHLHIIDLLLSYRSDLLTSACSMSCRFGHIHVVRHLVNAGATVCEYGFAEACRTNQILVVEYLLSITSSFILSGLFAAAKYGYVELFKMLYRLAPWSLLTRSNQTRALELAAKEIYCRKLVYFIIANGNPNIDVIMFQVGAVEDVSQIRLIMNLGATNIETCLQGACSGNNLSVVQHLLELGAASTHAYSEIAFMWACYRGSIEVMLFLIDAGHAHLDAGMRDALLGGRHSSIILLIDLRCEVPVNYFARSSTHYSLEKFISIFELTDISASEFLTNVCSMGCQRSNKIDYLLDRGAMCSHCSNARHIRL